VRYLTYFLAGMVGFLLLSVGLLAVHPPAVAQETSYSALEAAMVQPAIDAAALSHREPNFYQ
jgi:hypothetical protein